MTRRQELKRNPRQSTEKDFDNWLRAQPCLVCQWAACPSDVAHVATSEGPRAGKIPLCPWHHRRRGEGGGAASHHQLGTNFWTHHFGDGATADTWVNYYRNRYEKLKPTWKLSAGKSLKS